MENATQALFIAATVLIFIIIVSFAVWMFGSASAIGQKYDLQMSELEIQKHNAQFSEYNQNPKFINKGDKTDIRPYDYENVNKNYVLYEFNSVSDVVSAINKAYSINAKRNYDVLTGVQVTISGLNNIDGIGKTMEGIYGISPLYQKVYHDKNKSDKNGIYKLLISSPSKKILDLPSDVPPDIYELNILLKLCNQENKLVQGTDGKVRTYKYFFAGDVSMNDDTGLIDVINFECIKNKLYELYDD